MKKSTTQAISEIISLLRYVKKIDIPPFKTFLEQNPGLLQWHESFTELPDSPIVESFPDPLSLDSNTAKIVFFLIHDKITLNISILRDTLDRELNRNLLPEIQEIIDRLQ